MMTTGLTVAVHGRVFATHRHHLEDWGIGGSLRFDAGRDGQGLSLRVAPAWGGVSASRLRAVWEHGVRPTSDPANHAPVDGSVTAVRRLDAEIGYGVATFDGGALVTPYGGLFVAGESVRGYRAGVRVELDRLEVRVYGRRGERAGVPDQYRATLGGRLRY